jgi:hypothetical protein
MSNCKLHGMNLFEMNHKTDSNMLLSVPGNEIHGNRIHLFKVFFKAECLTGLFNSVPQLITATREEVWYWTGGNAINNVAYSEDVEVPEFTWRWFSTGVEIPRNFSSWKEGEPQQGFDKVYQTYVGCVATNKKWELKTFNCRTLLPYICEKIWEV